MSQRAMQTLLKPVIQEYFGNYRLPEVDTILQVIGQKEIIKFGSPVCIQLALSDGTYFFSQFVVRHDHLPGMPGLHSLIRIIASGNNKLIRSTSRITGQTRDIIYIASWSKILDGQCTNGRIGDPIKIFPSHDTGRNPDMHWRVPDMGEFGGWLKLYNILFG